MSPGTAGKAASPSSSHTSSARAPAAAARRAVSARGASPRATSTSAPRARLPPAAVRKSSSRAALGQAGVVAQGHQRELPRRRRRAHQRQVPQAGRRGAQAGVEMGRAGTGARRRAAHGQDRPAGGRSADGAGARERGPVVAGGGDDGRAHPVGRRERLRHRVDAAAVEGARDPQQDHVRPVPGVAVAVRVDRPLQRGQHPVGAGERLHAAARRLPGHHPVGQQPRDRVGLEPLQGRVAQHQARHLGAVRLQGRVAGAGRRVGVAVDQVGAADDGERGPDARPRATGATRPRPRRSARCAPVRRAGPPRRAPPGPPDGAGEGVEGATCAGDR